MITVHGEEASSKPEQFTRRVKSARNESEKAFASQEPFPPKRRTLMCAPIPCSERLCDICTLLRWATNHDQTRCGWEGTLKSERSLSKTISKAGRHAMSKSAEPCANAAEGKDCAYKKVNVKPFDPSLQVKSTPKKVSDESERKGEEH
eukprot:757458-Hanusia_phi.AAC.14